MEYNFREIEKKWQSRWKAEKVYEVSNDESKPKSYILDMFPYPSGAGLHVGHPLGYIASDIYARYKRLKGFNVLHPMGFDAFGLPAEQYAIDHGVHPAVSTEENIETFHSQLENIGFSYDWSREVRTCDPKYYKWTQWIFLQIFDSWFNRKTQKAERIKTLISIFEKEGNVNVEFPNAKYELPSGTRTFSARDWKELDEHGQHDILMQYRLAYLAFTEVNWCEALGTVLANDEVVNGVSERGGFPVVKRKMRQWSLRITEYAERLLKGLEEIDFSESMKEVQRNWIGKSFGAEIDFEIAGQPIGNNIIRVFTTRPDTLFGVDFMVLAPEHDLVSLITSHSHRKEVDKYLEYVQSRSEIERMAEVKKITGAFTGAYAIHPFTGNKIPIWTSEYVLAGYGTGAIMGVPSGDERDHKFAKHFNITITNIIGDYYNGEEANPTKDAILQNSDFLDGMVMRNAIEVVIDKVEEKGIGKRQINYKMRDAGWSRQRYWGEPFPVKFKHGMPYALAERDLPLELPPLDDFKSAGTGEGPLANVKGWASSGHDTNTMPTHAGAAWYFLRYMDPHNDKEFANRKALDYWKQVDVYIGGAEHAVAHLLYSRLWVKVLHDLGYLNFDEPFKKLINQGKIGGVSQIIYRFHGTGNYEFLLESEHNLLAGGELFPGKPHPHTVSLGAEPYAQYFSADFISSYPTLQFSEIHVPIEFVSNDVLDIDALLSYWGKDRDGVFVTKDGYFMEGSWYDFDRNEIIPQVFKTTPRNEKMSKRYYNVLNPDDVVTKYGADTFRMYEMFLGPLEASKPWDVKGIEGVHRFIKKLWRLFYDDVKGTAWNDEKANDKELKVLHRSLKKIEDDTERFSFNTAVSAFMVLVNELTDLNARKKELLEPLLIALSSYAPHVAEELWQQLGHNTTILDARYPKVEEKYLVETVKEYPISINGKLRTQIHIHLDAAQPEVEQIVLQNDIVKKWLEGKPPKKIIYVKGKMVNVVV
jgi:leucyl-tRNA synthetase